MNLSRSAALPTLLAPAVALAHGAEPHGEAVARTSLSIELAALGIVAVAAVLYLTGVRRLWRDAGMGQGIRRAEVVAYLAGLGSLAVALAPPLDRASAVSFAAHMAQHQLLLLVAPPLLVAGRPHVAALFALRAARRERVAGAARNPVIRAAWRAVTGPLVAATLHALAIWLWHVPALWEAALARPWLHGVQHATFFATAILFWWAMLQGRYGRAGYGVAVVYVFATALHTSALGALLAYGRSVWYPANAGGAAPHEALASQQAGGVVMWVPSGILFTLLGVGLFAAWLGELERRGGRRLPRGRTAALLAVTALAATAACAGPRRGATPAPATPKPALLVYVTNEGSNDLTVIDAGTDEVVATIHVGKRPRGIRVSADARTIYVALSGSPRSPPGVDPATLPPPDRAADGIGVVDAVERRLVRVLPSGQDPESFDLSADGRLLFVSNEETAEASVLDLGTGRIVATVPVGVEPEGVRTSPDGGFVYVTSETDHEVAVLDAATRAVVAEVRTGKRPRGVAFTPDGARAFVTCEEGASITVVNARTHAAIGEILLGAPAKPMGAAIAPDGRTLYVTTGRGRSVVYVDTATSEVVRTVDGVGVRPWGIAVTPDGRKLYTANGPSNDVAVLDAATGEILRRIPAGGLPWGVAIAPSPP